MVGHQRRRTVKRLRSRKGSESLKGKQITVRPMRNEDIGPFREKSLDLESRGPWYPLPGTSLAAF